MKYNSFQTPERRLLGAGPTNLYPEISEALTRPEVGHLDPKFVEMMDEVKSMLRYLFQTKNEFISLIVALLFNLAAKLLLKRCTILNQVRLIF